jgi:prephenate dehydrogenase
MKPAFPDLSQATVAIVGLGLMGGSLAAALKQRHACRRVIGIARRQATLDIALAHGWIDVETTNLAQGVADADIVVLATPPRVVLQQIRAVGPMLPAGALLIDLASTKVDIVSTMSELPATVHPIGGHPMCGKEQTGLEAADAYLYRNRPFVLTPLDRTPPEAVELARAIATAVGARPVILDAETHDRRVAWASHLPHVVAVTLMRAAMSAARDDADIWTLTANGFRDTTRLAASSEDMLTDIFVTNRTQILEATRQFQSRLTELCRLLEDGDDDALAGYLHEVICRRREIR